MTAHSVLEEMRRKQQDKLFHEIIHDWLSTKATTSKSNLYKKLVRKHYEQELIGEPMGKSTFYAKVNSDIDPKIIQKAKSGRVAAKNMSSTKTKSAEIICFTSNCEHDVLHAPIALLDPATFKPLQRTVKEYFTIEPMLSVLLSNTTDFSGRGENDEMLIEHLKSILLPKPNIHTAVGEPLPFYAYCSIVGLILDNAAHNKSKTAQYFLAQYNIIAKYARTRSGQDKPHIESFNKTFKFEFLEKLPGSYNDRVNQSDRDIISVWRSATLTTEEYEILKWRYLIQYNYAFDKKRGFYRDKQWIAETTIQPIELIVDVKKLLAEGGITEERTINKAEGVTITQSFSRIRYNSAPLQEMFRSLRAIKGAKWDGKVKIRRSSFSENEIIVINDITGEVIAVPKVESAHFLNLFIGDDKFYKQLAREESQRDLKSLSSDEIILHAIARKKLILEYHKNKRNKAEAVSHLEMIEKDKCKVEEASIKYSESQLLAAKPINDIHTEEATDETNDNQPEEDNQDWDDDENPF